ncbi:O-antigen ligase family protein [Brevundimonas diminuta]|uniref:O-antigen ligase family protein n=1 Tax=Brevundimonas diminuta TaxID=293 RepID=UPI000B3570B4|nr:O-antigen ligase [Brevundimonas diminuta]
MPHPSLTLFREGAPVRAVRPEPQTSSVAPRLWEQVAAAFILFLLTGALIGPIFAPQQQELPALRLIWPPVYLIILGLMAFRARQMAAAWPAFILLALMVILALASGLWSQAPDVTQRRVLALALTGGFSIYLGVAFQGAELPRLLTWTFLALGVGSLIAVFLFPSLGVHHSANAGLWRGLWYEKNHMGMIMAVGLIAASALLAAGAPQDRRIAVAAIGVCALALLGSQSKTALIMAMLGGGLIAMCRLIARMGPVFGVVIVWSLGLTAVISLWVWSQYSVEILALFGKDPTLTGRTEIWAAIERMAAQRPWLGYGYGAFWVLDTEPMEWIRHETGWRVPSAHHGWLDLRVQLGWTGTWLVGAVIALTATAILFRLNSLGRREGYLSLAYLAAFLLLSVSESVLMSHQDLPWTLFVAVLARNLASDRTA